MPAEARGSVFQTPTGCGIRWPENGKRPQKTGFRTKTDARRWFAENVAPRLGRGGPSNEITFDAFCEIFLERHGATIAASTKETLAGRLPHSRRVRWLDAPRARGRLRRRGRLAGRVRRRARYRVTSAMRQALAAAVRWKYLDRNPAADAGKNPQPRRRRSSRSPRRDRHDRRRTRHARRGTRDRRRRDRPTARGMDCPGTARSRPAGPGAPVQRKYAKGVMRPYGKSHRARRRVPLTAKAFEAIEQLPPRLDTELLFPAPMGGHLEIRTGAHGPGIRRSRRPGSRSVARTTCGTRSRPRRSPPASPRSSCPG